MAQKYICGNCKKEVSASDAECPHCKEELEPMQDGKRPTPYVGRLGSMSITLKGVPEGDNREEVGYAMYEKIGKLVEQLAKKYKLKAKTVEVVFE